MNEKRFRTAVQGMDAEKRVSFASEKLESMMDNLIALICLHESNAFVVYSPTLTDQIPHSYAANAYNMVQNSLHQFEVVRLCTFWDGIDLDKDNIPTVIELVDDAGVFDAIRRETEGYWLGQGAGGKDYDDDPVIQKQIQDAIDAGFRKTAVGRAEVSVETLKNAIDLAQNTIDSEKLKSVRNLRDKLAHQLKETRLEKREGNVAPMKYGDERDLLETTISVIEGLRISISGTSFDWEGSRTMARRDATSLWGSCTFDISD